MAAKSNKYGDYWMQSRPKGPINFSNVNQENTIYDTSHGSQFDPNEITGRSTSYADSKSSTHNSIDVNAMSVDDILGNSFVENIRHMSQNKHTQADTSHSASIPRKHVSNASEYCDKFNWNQSFPAGQEKMSEMSEQFRPSEEMGEELMNGEKEWQQEFAAVPYEDAESSGQPTPAKSNGNAPTRAAGNMDEFSAMLDDSTPVRSSGTETSIGQYFLRNCGSIRDMLPESSPTKSRPVPLLGNSYRSSYDSIASTAPSRYSHASSIAQATGEMRGGGPRPRVNNATYDRDQSVASISTIAARLNDCDSPRTILTELVGKASKKAAPPNANAASPQFVRPQTVGKPSLRHGNPVAAAAKESLAHDGTELGMLKRMDSGRLHEKENQWRQDASADTVASETITDEIDVSSFSYRPGNADSTARSNKRMRSPDQDALQADLENMRLSSPTRDMEPPIAAATLRKCNSEQVPAMARNADYRPTNDLDRSRRSMNFTLPNCVPRPTHHSTPTVGPTRSSSQCSTNSEFTQNDGKFPLKANTSELSWECVKLRKSVIKSFVVKNASNKKLGLKMEVVGPGYQIASSGADKESVTLQGQECRTIFITFCPTVIGKAIGKVIFKPSRQWSEETERLIHLCGFGGNTVLQLQGVERAPVGVPFLVMGETSHIRSPQLQRSFTIYNKGPLNGIATIFVKPKNNQYANESHIHIEPSKCVIQPDSSTDIMVSYKLRRKDLEKLKSCEVLTVGTLEVITGAEPNRLRIASILRRAGTTSNYEQLEFLMHGFPASASDRFDDFRESADKVPDLFGCFKTSEIALTINSTMLDETRDNCSDLSIDDTVMFKTIIETPKEPVVDAEQLNDTWSVVPERLLMVANSSVRKTLTIRSHFRAAQTFQIDSNNRSLFNFSRTSGCIRPGGECTVDVELKANSNSAAYGPTVIAIYIERDSCEIPVIIRDWPPT